MNIVINSQFKPFSYQELVLPAMQATELHSTIEQAAAELESNAEMWRSKIGDKDDEKALGLYNSFYGKLKAQTDDLAMNGLNVNSRRQLYKLKADYNREILPIETAYKKRQELVKQRAEMAIKDPSMVSDIDPSKLSLSQLIENPEMIINYESGERLRQVAAQTAGSMAKSLLSDPGKLKGILPHQYQQIIQYGATPAQLLQAINEVAAGNPNSQAAKFLEEIRTNIIASSPISAWGNEELTKRGGWADSFINLGAYAMIGQADVKNHADQFSMNLDLEKIKRQWAADDAARAAAVQAANADGLVNVEGAINEDEVNDVIKDLLSNNIIDDTKLNPSGSKKFSLKNGKSLGKYISYKFYDKINSIVTGENPIENLMSIGFSKDEAQELRSAVIMKTDVPPLRNGMAGPSVVNKHYLDKSKLKSQKLKDMFDLRSGVNRTSIKLALGSFGDEMLNYIDRNKDNNLVNALNAVVSPADYAHDLKVFKGMSVMFDSQAAEVARVHYDSAIGKHPSLAVVDSKTGSYKKGKSLKDATIEKTYGIVTLGDKSAMVVDLKDEDGKELKAVKIYLDSTGYGALQGLERSSGMVRQLSDDVQKVYEDDKLNEEQKAAKLHRIRQDVAAMTGANPDGIDLNNLTPTMSQIATSKFRDNSTVLFGANKK